jgi:MFS family permease
MSSQMLGGVGVASGIAVGAMLAEETSGSASLSGLAPTCLNLGTALAAVPLARLMSRRGRRPGLAAGYVVGATGAFTAVIAGVLGSFPLLLFGMVLFGSATATNLQARYAATDCATDANRGRALSIVVWATTIGAVTGPNLAGVAGRLATGVHLPELTGAFLFSIAAFATGGTLITLLLRPDPLFVARAALTDEDQREPRLSFKASIGLVRSSRRASLGLVSIAISQAVMVSVMSMTPVHMRHHGAELTVVGFVISGHIAGMYALSPLVGWLSDRFGRVPMILTGQGVLLLSCLIAATAGPHSTIHLGVGLFLLGLGWSFGLVAGSTLLSESVPSASRAGVQGSADFIMSSCGVFGGALAGVVVGTLGYVPLNVIASLLVVPAMVMALRVQRRSPAPNTEPMPKPRLSDSGEIADVSVRAAE